MVELRAFGRGDRGSKPPPPFRSLGNFVHPTLPVSFGGESKSRSSLLSGGKGNTCYGLTELVISSSKLPSA